MKRPRPESLGDIPGAPPAGTVLCRVSDLGSQGARAFQFRDGELRYDIFIQRWDDAVYAYRDSCPHLKLPLDYRGGQYLDASGRHLQCAHHGALFRVEDGYCIDGPCKRRWLTPIRLRIDGDQILLA